VVPLGHCMLAPVRQTYACAALASVRWRTVQRNVPFGAIDTPVAGVWQATSPLR